MGGIEMTRHLSGTRRMVVFLCLGLWIAFQSVNGQIDFSSERANHQLKHLSANKQKSVAKLSNHSSLRRNILQPLLIERVADTDGNREVQRHIKNWMQTKLGWTVEEDSFNDSTPLGTKKFTNIIATFDPSARRRLVFACHFDSKLFEQFTFIGATDSAVPCAMLIDLARSLNSRLDNTDSAGEAVSLQLIFFDGEEAFRRWSATDSLYGSRHLAEKWYNTTHPQDNSSRLIEGMDMLVLLDLIGHRNPQFSNFFPQSTGRFYDRLNAIEGDLHRARLLRGHRPNQYFMTGNSRGVVEDDHIPFMRKQVPILHLISVPFPNVWHTVNDNANAIHHRTVNNINSILRVFIAEYLRLRV